MFKEFWTQKLIENLLIHWFCIEICNFLFIQSFLSLIYRSRYKSMDGRAFKPNIRFKTLWTYSIQIYNVVINPTVKKKKIELVNYTLKHQAPCTYRNQVFKEPSPAPYWYKSMVCSLLLKFNKGRSEKSALAYKLCAGL
jgi:hypothetical protein